LIYIIVGAKVARVVRLVFKCVVFSIAESFGNDGLDGAGK